MSVEVVKMLCKDCPFNNFKQCGVDFCILPKCIYELGEETLKRLDIEDTNIAT